jgi:hypothetical protein
MSRQQPRANGEMEPRPRKSGGMSSRPRADGDPRPRADGDPRPRADKGRRPLPERDRDRAPRAHPSGADRSRASRAHPSGEDRTRAPRARPNPRPRPAPHPVLHPRPALFSNRTNWSGVLAVLAWVTAAALALGRRLLAAITGEVGRRLARAVGLTVVLAVVVTALYDRGEAPTAAAQQAVQAPSGGNQGGSAARGGAGARRKDPAELGGLRGRDRVTRAGERPAAVAAAWYAAHHGVPRARVKPLQQDRRSSKEVRVLVLADHGQGRLRTALVRLRHGADGWSVR